MQRPLLVTGFDAFGNKPRNPSADLIGALAETAPIEWKLHVLPTAFRRAEQQVLELLDSYRPLAVLHFGLAGNREAIAIERRAQNRDNSPAPDNEGMTRGGGQAIVPGAQASYGARLPIAEMVAAAAKAGEAVELSDDAGGFVCNHVFYVTAHWAALKAPHLRFGFVHLPPLAEGSARFSNAVSIVRLWLSLLREPPISGA